MFSKFMKSAGLAKEASNHSGHMHGAACSLLTRLDRAAIITDANGVIQYLNEPATQFLGCAEETVIGKSIATRGETRGQFKQQAHRLPRHPGTGKGHGDSPCHRFGPDSSGRQPDRGGRQRGPGPGIDQRIVGAMVLLQDVSRLRKINDSLAHEARHDALTGLVNRREFQSRLEVAFEGSRQRGENHALCYLDLDQFKVINDSCGHAAGDQLLRKVTELLKSLLPSDETLARLGGDEFGLLIQNAGVEEATRITENMLAAIKAFRFYWEGRTFSIGVSIGVTVITRKSIDLKTVMSIADSACYAAKEKGRNRIQVYNPDDIELDQRQQEMRVLSRITSALDENRYVLYFQSIIPVCAKHDNSQHCEILVRMVNADGTLVQPGQFIPAAERYNLMPALDRWIIKRVFEVFHKRYPTPELKREHQWSVNISGTSLGVEGFVEYIRELAARYEIIPTSICFEITETAAIADIDRVSNFLWGLRMDGFKFALDDFGIGMSSFSYLKSLPVDYVKIDGEFIKNILDEKVSLAMTEAITRVVSVMGIEVVAEYVESIAILNKLREIGVHYAQGYGVSEPILLDEHNNVSNLADARMRKWAA
jgi:diguanylate cyclase (GGDEF)-like protein